MRNFFKTIYLSISSFDFYHQVEEKSFWRILGFYVLFLVLVTLARSFPIIFYSLPQLQTDISRTFEELRTHYPAGLILSWDGEKLQSSINPQPIYYPSTFKNYFSSEKIPNYFALINVHETNASPSAEAIFTITQTDILTQTENNDITQLALRDVIGTNSHQVDSNFVVKVQNYWETHATSFLRVSQVFLPFVLYFLFLFQRISMVLIESVLFLLFKKIQGRPWSYATSIKYGLHFFVAAEFVDIVANYVYPEATISLFSLTVWIYFMAISFMAPRKKLS